MDWKRIMNKKRMKADGAAEREEIQQCLTQLPLELNFRLLLQTEVFSQEILWVESVTVTSYQPTPVKKQFQETDSLSGWMWNHLTEMLGKSIFLRNKKERR